MHGHKIMAERLACQWKLNFHLYCKWCYAFCVSFALFPCWRELLIYLKMLSHLSYAYEPLNFARHKFAHQLRNNESTKQRKCETAKVQNNESTKLRKCETTKERNSESVKVRNNETARLRNNERAKQRKCESAKQKNKNEMNRALGNLCAHTG